MALYLTEEDVAAVLTMDIALEEVEKGFVHLAEGRAFNFPRVTACPTAQAPSTSWPRPLPSLASWA